MRRTEEFLIFAKVNGTDRIRYRGDVKRADFVSVCDEFRTPGLASGWGCLAFNSFVDTDWFYFF